MNFRTAPPSKPPATVLVAMAMIIYIMVMLTTQNIAILHEQLSGPFRVSDSDPLFIGAVVWSILKILISVILIIGVYFGKNWARLLYSVPMALFLVLGVYAFSQPDAFKDHSPASVALHFSFKLASIVLLFMPASNRWFRRA